MRINLNYCVLGTIATALLCSNDHSLYAPTYRGWTSCLISFVWDQSTSQERVESDTIQKEKFLPTMVLGPTVMRFEVYCSTDLPNHAWWKLSYLDYLYTYMYFCYQCIQWYKFETDEVSVFYLVNVLFCVTYWNIPIYCTNSEKTHKSCVCFQYSTRSGICMLKANTGLVCLFAICAIEI